MSKQEINIPLDSIEEGLFLTIKSTISKSVFEVNDADQNGEAPFQIKEGCFYHYQFSSSDFFFASHEVVEQNPFNINQGRLSPNIYVGTLEIPIYKKFLENAVGNVKIEVRSKKTEYRKDYRFMLESITEYCIDLLMQVNSPVTQTFEPDYFKSSETLYQKFSFIKSVIDTDEFNEAVHRIIISPNTAWSKSTEEVDVRNIGRFKNHHVRQLITGTQRSKLPTNHIYLKKGISSLPTKLHSDLKVETVDTAENRFIKHALTNFLKLCTDIESAVKPGTRIYQEVQQTIEKLEQHLHHTFFSEISRAQILKLNSPILQRKEGYREVLRSWLMFDLAAKLIWQGGEDVYRGGKKDVATLYEYWLFFIILDILKELFDIDREDLEALIKPTKDALSLQLAQGKNRNVRGIYKQGVRKLQMNFSFNRTFSVKEDHPKPGSWTKPMRPDYTLSIWPLEMDEERAEREEIIVHIHFDAKYKIDNLVEIIDENTDPNEEKLDQIKGSYKNADLLKMHAYKDAIRRTAGAYVLYPGNDPIERRGFHELLPGLGAFPVRPSRTHNGSADLKDFLSRVISHFLNRASHRENLAFRVYDIHKNEPNKLNESIPEAYGKNRGLIPDITSVLVAYYHKDNFDWILKSGLINLRTGSDKGSLPLGPAETGAKYVLLHSKGETVTSKLFKVVKRGPRIFSKHDLIKKGYPTQPSQDFYLVYKIEPITDLEFQNIQWNISELSGYKKFHASAIPFTASLTELMNSKVKQS